MVQWLVQILKIATILVLSGLVLLGGARAFEHFQAESRPDDIGKVYTVKINEADDTDAIAALLEDNGLINSKTYFTSRMRVVNQDLIPGSYRLVKGMSVGEIIDTITGNSDGSDAESGSLASSDNTTLSIPSYSDRGVITADDTYPVGGSESGYIAVKPDDLNTVYVGAVGSSPGATGCLTGRQTSTPPTPSTPRPPMKASSRCGGRSWAASTW